MSYTFCVDPSQAAHGFGVAARDFAARWRLARGGLDEISTNDVYIAPHSDDICFSLGNFVSRRRQGTILTLFAKSSYVAPSLKVVAEDDARTVAVSSLRQDEDRAFARDVGMRIRFGDLCEAPLRGLNPFDDVDADADVLRLEDAVVAAILAAASENTGVRRPWLFCPMGIGNHRDHLVVLKTVLGRYRFLRERWRIAFYEDLHYAAEWHTRKAGLKRFRTLAAPLRMRRTLWPIRAPADKLALVRLYSSQFTELPTAIEPFSPAQRLPAPLHEGLWIAERP